MALDLSKFVASLAGKDIYVYGLGKSGLASVEALVNARANVIAWDNEEIQRDRASQLGASLLDHESIIYQDLGSIILSPGVSLTHPEPHPVVVKAQAESVSVIGDIEVFGRCLSPSVKTIGITGTNGKSTTTALIGHILKECGMNVVVGGNIGTPVLSLDINKQTQVVVLEMSSYQIDLCPTFRPDIGLLLNITPDHLERHGTMENYAAVKAKIFGNQTKEVVSVDDEYCSETYKKRIITGHDPIPLTLKQKLPFDPAPLKTLAGAHNHQNALAAWHVGKLLELEEDRIYRAMKCFPGLAHRQQIVRQIGSITFINDSKATNAEAAAKALSTYDNIHWILGGLSKQGGLAGLEPYMKRVKQAYLIGRASDEFAIWLEEQGISCKKCNALDVAVKDAYKDALEDDMPSNILLSPACASWDQFKSFEERGEVFTKIVGNLGI